MRTLLFVFMVMIGLVFTDCTEQPPRNVESDIAVIFDNETTSMLPFYEITINDSFLVKSVISVSYDSIKYEDFNGDTSMYLPMGTRTTIYFRLKSNEDN